MNSITAPISSLTQSARSRVSTEAAILGAVLIILQIADGLLTGFGVGQFGTHAEGNAVIRALMDLVGHVPALVITKGIAIGIIIGLCHFARQIPWISHAMKIVIGIYIGAAIIPWTMILAVKAI